MFSLALLFTPTSRGLPRLSIKSENIKTNVRTHSIASYIHPRINYNDWNLDSFLFFVNLFELDIFSGSKVIGMFVSLDEICNFEKFAFLSWKRLKQKFLLHIRFCW